MMSNVVVSHDRGQSAGTFTLVKDDTKIGRLEYVWDDANTLRATHTYIPVEYRGQNLGDHLFDALMTFVKEQDVTLIPECPYIELKLERMKAEKKRTNDA